MNKPALNNAVIGVVGLGYVGLPLAQAFSRKCRVIGLDIDAARIAKISRDNRNSNLALTTSPAALKEADFIIICVPTPVTASKEPDLSFVRNAAEITGRNMKRGVTIILESTVYPGVTEEIVRPVLERESGLRCGPDFRIAYAPERINPGDSEHSLEKITKVVAGMDSEVTDQVAELYQLVTPHVFKAKDIRTAEAAKLIENIQRDLNIALTNELAIIFGKMGLSSRHVFEAAATKWNFHRYYPGMVGGHCIPVVPYYLVYKSRQLGYHPQVILAGRMINDAMPIHIATMTIKALNRQGKVIKGSRVLVLGLSYKENVPDTRQSPTKVMIKELEEYGVQVFGFEPLIEAEELQKEFGIPICHNLQEMEKVRPDAVILTVAHTALCQLSLPELKKIQNDSPVLIDVPGIYDREEAAREGFLYETL